MLEILGIFRKNLAVRKSNIKTSVLDMKMGKGAVVKNGLTRKLSITQKCETDK
jgi:hypothetical protein